MSRRNVMAFAADYYFDTLPLHPQPQPLESLTSYLTRVAEANEIRRYSQLNSFFGEYHRISSFTDYPPRSFGSLPVITSCSEFELLSTTFYHLGKKFGRSYGSPWLAGFLSGVVASSLRYCPHCLQEALYYSLSWRILPLVGCPRHACRLLEHCGHCSCPVPIFHSPFRIGMCPSCGGDLRECIPSRLTEEELWRVTIASREIEFLLRPLPYEITETALLERVGKEFMLLRYDKQLKRKDASLLTKIRERNLEAIELGRGATVRFYIEYANFLGVPLSQIYINALERKEEDLRIKIMPGKFYLASEEWVMQRVQEAVRHIEISGQRLTLKAITAATGFSEAGLYKYERVKTFIRGMLYKRQSPPYTQDPLYENELLEKAWRAIQTLTQEGNPITHQAVCSLIGISSKSFFRHPKVKKLVGRFVDYDLQQRKHTEEYERAFLEKVRMGVLDLEEHQQPVTYNAISHKIGIHHTKWLHYAQVRAFVDQHLDSRYLRALKQREQREEVLFLRVEKALSQLEAAGSPVTFEAVRRLLGVDPKTLQANPRVNELIKQRKEQRKSPLQTHRGRQPRRSEEEVYAAVQRVIPLLTECNIQINYTQVAREIGDIAAQTLRAYPKVRMLVDEHLRSYQRYQLQQFALREEQLLREVEATLTELEAQGKPFTQNDLCKMVGKSPTVLKQFPRVKALLEQKLTTHHVYQRGRAEPAEEEIVQRVKVALIELSDHGEHITMKKVVRKVNITDVVLIQYPQVVMLLEQYGYQKPKPRSERVEELLNLVKDAITTCKVSGQPIRKVRLAGMVGVDCATLRRYPEVWTLISQAVSEDKQIQERRFRAREEEMTQQVIAALQLLRDNNMRISKKAIEDVVHATHICERYPKVKALIESAIQTQHTPNETAGG